MAITPLKVIKGQ